MSDRHEWNEETATAMVRAAVERKRGLFGCFPDLGSDDLTAEILDAVRRAYPKFNPAKATFSTWLGMVAGARLIDLWRKRSREAARQGAYAARRGESYLPDVPDFEKRERSDASLAEWLSETYLLSKRAMGVRRLRDRRRFFNAAQAVTIAMLAERKGLSIRGVRALFASSEELRRAVRFQHLPSQGWFQYTLEKGAELLAQAGPKKVAALRARQAVKPGKPLKDGAPHGR